MDVFTHKKYILNNKKFFIKFDRYLWKKINKHVLEDSKILYHSYVEVPHTTVLIRLKKFILYVFFWVFFNFFSGPTYICLHNILCRHNRFFSSSCIWRKWVNGTGFGETWLLLISVGIRTSRDFYNTISTHTLEYLSAYRKTCRNRLFMFNICL